MRMCPPSGHIFFLLFIFLPLRFDVSGYGKKSWILLFAPYCSAILAMLLSKSENRSLRKIHLWALYIKVSHRTTLLLFDSINLLLRINYREKNEVKRSGDQCLKSRTHSKINRGIHSHDVPPLDD